MQNHLTIDNRKNYYGISKMSDEIEILIQKLKTLEDEIETAIEAKKAKFYQGIQDGKAVFDEATKKAQRKVKIGIDKYIFKSKFATIITAPVIYGMIIPFVILDIALGIYQLCCFTAWQIPRVKRSKYIVIDRQYLDYLNIIEKINCVYCGYGNGLMAYGREVAGRTEQYWCPIKHAMKTKTPHDHYKNFVEYGDFESYKAQLEKLRDDLRKLKDN